MKCKMCQNYKDSDCKVSGEFKNPDKERNCSGFHIISNGDKIRAMNDEELAEFLGKYFYCEYACAAMNDTCYENCDNAIIEWLQSEAEEK